MVSFRGRSNITFFDEIRSYPNYIKLFLDNFHFYRIRFKNYFYVSKCVFKNKYPINGILKNGKKILIANRMQASIIAHGWEDFCDIQKGLLTIKMKDLPEVKFYNWENNGDIYQIFFQREYLNFPTKDNVVIDIGANICDSSIYFALIGAKKVIALEPLPKNFEMAMENIALNGLSQRIELLLAGCSNKGGFTQINPEKSGTGYTHKKDIESVTKIPLLTLEEILKKANADSIVLKIDCEGCEYETILLASDTTLQRFNFIQLEYHFGYKNLKKKLEKCGFNVHYTNPRAHWNPFEKTWGYVGDMYAKKAI